MKAKGISKVISLIIACVVVFNMMAAGVYADEETLVTATSSV